MRHLLDSLISIIIIDGAKSRIVYSILSNHDDFVMLMKSLIVINLAITKM